MKLPVKDRDTIPWMSKREIPVIKILLSVWRQKRKISSFTMSCRHDAECTMDPVPAIERRADYACDDLEFIAALEERLRKEAKK